MTKLVHRSHATRVSVVIVSWNVREQLQRCLASAGATLRDGDELIVVDNASSDATVETVRTQFPDVRLLVNSSNRLFAAAANQGMKAATNELILILNPDTSLDQFSLAELSYVMDSHSDIGALGFQMVNEDGTLQSLGRERPNLANTAAQWLLPYRFYLPIARWRRAAKGFVPTRGLVPVASLSGSALCLRRRVLDELGGFDETLPMYAEDVDLVERIRDRGHGVYCSGDLQISHVGSASADQVPTLRIIWGFQARRAYLLKHGSSPLLVDALFRLSVALRLMAWRVISSALRRRHLRARSAVEAYRHLWLEARGTDASVSG